MQWDKLEIGGGQVNPGAAGNWRLSLPATPEAYADAQIDDTQGLRRREYRWNPPVCLSLEARADPGSPQGTLGFGFWNDPFSASLGFLGGVHKIPATPQAVWFFYLSSPGALELVPGAQGAGWMAMVLRSPSIPGWIALPAALLAIGLAKAPLTRGAVIRSGQAWITAAQAQAPTTLEQWHQYEILWSPASAVLKVDGEIVLDAPFAPQGPLGFIAWIDNQFAIVSPSAGLRMGVLRNERSQYLELRSLALTPL